MHIQQLRINDGGPVSAEAPVEVTVRCDPGARAPRGLRLRVGYLLDNVVLDASRLPLADIPADGVLRLELEPFPEAAGVPGFEGHEH